MLRILLLSDSHGNVKRMAEAVENTRPDMICHMGDCWRDAEELKEMYPMIPMEQVIGNCDWNDDVAEKVFETEGFRIMMCHGHRYGVKGSLLYLDLKARELEADIVLFGHTHELFYDNYNGHWLFNPGSIGLPAFGNPPSYIVLTLNDGELDFETYYLK